MITKQDLIDFEEDIAAEFNRAKIRAPIHLYNGNEDQMIEIFEKNKIGIEDWVFCSWRSHYECLLKGVPKDILKKDIMDGKSISLCYPEHNIFSSAIVTGILPIAVGVAFGLKQDGKVGKVYCFVGDMTAETGCFEECLKYARNHKLPIKFIIEDNGKSVCTDTRNIWGSDKHSRFLEDSEYVYYYSYSTKWPHAGAGVRISF